MQHVTTWAGRAATTRFLGFVGPADFLECLNELTAHPRFDSTLFFVADFADISGHAIDTPFVREALAIQGIGARSTNSRYKIVVVTQDAGITAFTEKMRNIYIDGGPEIFTFATSEDATRWMDMQEANPRPRSA